MLARTGLAPLVDASADVDPLRHGAIWGHGDTEWRTEAEPGLLLRRGPFDDRLRAQVAAAGARVLCPATAMHTGENWVVTTADRVLDLAPGCVVDATGRVRKGERAVASEPTARAVAFTFVGTAHALDRGTAVVEAVRGGWVWTYAPQQAPASATLVVDAEELVALGRDALLADVLATSRGPAGRCTDLRLVHATDASSRWREPRAGWLAIGDAAATVDPLASQGVEKALAAADHAAAVVTTARARPELWPRLAAAHARWELGLWRGHQQAAAAWYRREERFAGEPFWQRRRTPEPAAAVAGATVYAPAPDLVAGPVLVRQGPRFTTSEGVCAASTGDERTHIGYVPIQPVLAAFATPRRLDQAVQAAGADPRLFVLPPRAVYAAMLELVRLGWLTPAANATGNR